MSEPSTDAIEKALNSIALTDAPYIAKAREQLAELLSRIRERDERIVVLEKEFVPITMLDACKERIAALTAEVAQAEECGYNIGLQIGWVCRAKKKTSPTYAKAKAAKE